ncbi:MAG: general secretion pathway protein GspK [Chromatiaceae bacterium]|nr:MAG: general secretion pathway protein GspK [Chromatiaceae bacterium]
MAFARRIRPPAHRPHRTVRPPRGIALVLVLWVLALLTVMALGLTSTQRTELALARNQIEVAQFRARAEAAIALTLLNLLSTPLQDPATGQALDTGDDGPWVPDGRPRTVWFDGVPLRVTLSNEGSRLDLNSASQEQLAALIEAVLGGTGAADMDLVDRLTDVILDWRDEDDLTRLLGAEDPEYAAAGLPYGARDGPFRSVAELRLLLGMTPDLYRRLAPEVTVADAALPAQLRQFGGGGELPMNPQFASPAVLAAQQGLTLDEAEEAVRLREEGLGLDGQPIAVVDRGGPAYRIRVTSSARAGGAEPAAEADIAPDAHAASGVRTMEAMVFVQPGTDPPYEVVWRRFGLLETMGPVDLGPDATRASQ